MVYRCSKCGAILWKYDAKSFKGIITPKSLVENLFPRCPVCGTELKGEVSKIVLNGRIIYQK